MKYAISDIHGEYKDFLAMIQLINLSSNDTLYVLGDAIDRGGCPIDTLKFIMANKNIEFILGNHEEMALEYFKTNDFLDRTLWNMNGGCVTMAQLDKLSAEERVDIMNYIETVPLYKIVDKYILCHSGLAVPVQSEGMSVQEILSMQRREDFLWSREKFFNFSGIKGYTIVFGHTITKNLYPMLPEGTIKPLSIWHDEMHGGDKIGIDCGATFKRIGGRLGCLRLDDRKEFYI